MADSSTLLTKEIRELALQEGAILFGISSIGRFQGAPRGHHPAEILMGARLWSPSPSLWWSRWPTGRNCS